jgi:hypothetical protein
MKLNAVLFAIVSGSVALLIIAIIAGAVLRGGNASTAPKVDYAADYASSGSFVRMTKIGPVKSEEDHREMIITVSSGQRKIETIKGYLGTPIKTQTFVNNTAAYQSLLTQLTNDGFFTVKTLKAGQKQDEAKTCTDGSRYKLELVNGKDTVLTNWGSTCGRGSLLSTSASRIEEDFTRQIPGFSEITRDLSF